jgi:hypothetical protein
MGVAEASATQNFSIGALSIPWAHEIAPEASFPRRLSPLANDTTPEAMHRGVSILPAHLRGGELSSIGLAYGPAQEQADRCFLISQADSTSPMEPDRCTSRSQAYVAPVS